MVVMLSAQKLSYYLLYHFGRMPSTAKPIGRNHLTTTVTTTTTTNNNNNNNNK